MKEFKRGDFTPKEGDLNFETPCWVTPQKGV